jgi:hypothetical protein
MNASDDIMESARPPKPPRPTDPHAAERRSSLLRHTVAIAAVVATVFVGIIAWETHQERVFTKNLYCSNFLAGPGSEPDPRQEKLYEQLGC